MPKTTGNSDGGSKGQGAASRVLGLIPVIALCGAITIVSLVCEDLA